MERVGFAHGQSGFQRRSTPALAQLGSRLRASNKTAPTLSRLDSAVHWGP